MTWHPKERGSTRRDFLMRSGGAALGLSGAGSLLAACGNSTTPTASTSSQGKPVGPGGLPLARPDNPVNASPLGGSDQVGLEAGDRRNVHRLQLSGLPVQEAPERVLREVRRHAAVHPVRQHRHRHSEAGRWDSAARRHGDDPDHLDQAVAGHLIKPLNLDYIPNLQQNIWPELVDPFYDKGSAVHRPLHALCDRHPLAHRSRQRGHRRYEATLGHLLAGPGVLGQGLHADGGPGDHRGGPAAQGGHRHQHRGPEADQSSG